MSFTGSSISEAQTSPNVSPEQTKEILLNNHEILNSDFFPIPASLPH